MTSKMITGTWYSELQVEEQGNKTRIAHSEVGVRPVDTGSWSKEGEEIKRSDVYVN